MAAKRTEPPRWQSVVAGRRDPEPRARKAKRLPVRGGTTGPGGWRPDPADPLSYRYDGATAIARYDVAGDAVDTDAAHDAGGSAVGAADLELLFWGDYWRSASGPSTGDVMGAMQRLLASPYLSALTQYGFSSLHLRGGTLVSAPAPPTPTFSDDEVRNMVWALIDDDVFPEPDDDGGRIIYLVVAPLGSTYNDSGARGAHTSAHDTDLFDGDDAWVGWSNWGDLDFITDVLSHELVEAVTNPLPGASDAWIMNRSIHGGDELGDACNNTADRLDGLLVQAYWSEKDKACVIPWHRYGAMLDTDSTTLDTATVASGISVASTGPCQPPAPYQWWQQTHHQRDEYRVTTSGYQSPTLSWSIVGKPVAGSGSVTFSATTYHPDASGPGQVTADVTLAYQITGSTMVVTNDPNDGTFSYDIAVTVAEAAKGSKRTTRELTGGAWVDGQDLVWDDAYTRARDACAAYMKALGTRMVQQLVPHIDRGDPPPPWVDNLVERIRGEDRTRVQELEHLAHYVERADPALAMGLRAVSQVYIGVQADMIDAAPNVGP